MKKIAFFTPLNPVHSGISDWAEELLPSLAAVVDIELFVDGYEVENEIIKNSFKIHNIEEYYDPVLRDKYDLTIFQAGNFALGHKNIMSCFMEFGGILELHDISMHHFLAETTVGENNIDEYLDIVEYCHGKGGRAIAKNKLEEGHPLWDTDPLRFSVIKKYVDRADMVIVHSDYARQTVKGINSEKEVRLIPLPVVDIVNEPQTSKISCRKKLQIPEDAFVMGSFGLATPTKRIAEIVNQLENVRLIYPGYKIRYYIVGENKIDNLKSIIREKHLEDVVYITGRVTIAQFKEYMEACDLCFNLRYPTQGESSASLHRMLGFGKLVAVTDIGSFREYPSEYVTKIRYDYHESADILQVILKNMREKDSQLKIIEKQISWVKQNLSVPQVVSLYKKCFMGEAEEQERVESYVENLTDQLETLLPYSEDAVERISSCR